MAPRIRSIVLALIAAMLAGAAPTTAAADGFVVIANARASVRSLSKADVRALYTGKTKTVGGAAAVVVVRAEDDAMFAQFVDQVFGIPTRALLSKIKQEVFKGEMAKPIKAASDDEVMQAVSGSPGTIGVVSRDAAGRVPKTVTVIAIGD